MHWGLDIIEPFPKATQRYLLVATDYFTKWVEAEPLANIRDQDVKRFVWQNIVIRTDTLLRHILRVMGKLRPQTRLY